MKTHKPSKKQTDQKFADKYEKIFEKSSYTPNIKREWRHPGDSFKKLSIYENYTPVKTSGSTTLIKEVQKNA